MMRQRRFRGQFVILALGLVIALVCAMPASVTADTPTAVAVGASVTFAGGGFAPNETLSVWETDSGGTATTQGSTQSDGNGNFTTTVSFPSAGTWTATAYSSSTMKQFVSTYQVSTTANTTTPPAPGSAPAATGTPVAVNAFITFTGSGFTPNEKISLWETPPDGSPPTALPPGVMADNTGAFATSVSFPSAGSWQVTAQGNTSGHQVISPFAVGTAGTVGVAPATGATVPVGGTAFNGTPASIGVPVVFSGSGFNANAQISLWETPPDGSPPTGLPGIQADNTGAFTTTVTFPSAGNWQVTAQGHDSTHQVIGRYAVSNAATAAATTTVPAATFTPPFAGTPMKATVGTTVAFTAAGFSAGETVSAWVTPPDPSAAVIAITPTVTASAAGQATVSTSFTSVGLWQITLQGLTSHRQVIGSYQVTTS